MGFSDFIGIMNQVHYLDNHFNPKQFHYMFLTISLFGTHIHNIKKSFSWIV